MTRHQLRIVVPVSMSDVHLLEGWVNVYRALGGAKGHPIEFHPTPKVASAANDAAQAIKNFSGSVELFKTDKDYTYGWPRACNAHYGHVMRSLATRRNTLPWLWCELDMLPMVSGFADTLIQEYVMTGGRGAMGIIMPMIKPRDENYALIDKQDLYMVGVGIYDPGYFHELGGLSDQIWRSNVAFDMHLRHYTKKAWRSTELMSTASRTVNYRLENGEIVMDDLSGKKPWEMRAGSVPRGTLLHHGCKDESLAKLIVASTGRPWQTVEEMLLNLATEVPKVAPAPEPPPPQQLMPAQRAPQPEVKSDPALAAAFRNAKLLHPDPVIPPPVTTEPGTAPQGAADAPFDDGLKPSPTVEALRTAISEAGKPMKIANFAEKFGVTDTEIKNLVKRPESGVNIVGGVWLKLGA